MADSTESLVKTPDGVLEAAQPNATVKTKKNTVKELKKDSSIGLACKGHQHKLVHSYNEVLVDRSSWRPFLEDGWIFLPFHWDEFLDKCGGSLFHKPKGLPGDDRNFRKALLTMSSACMTGSGNISVRAFGYTVERTYVDNKWKYNYVYHG